MADKAKLTLNNKSSNILAMFKGIFWAISVSLICILIFAFVIKFTNLPENIIGIINQIIKVLSILIGCFIACKKIKSNGWLWGLVIGALYTLFAFFIFSILDGEFRFSLNLLNDFVFGSIIGFISGIISNALRK